MSSAGGTGGSSGEGDAAARAEAAVAAVRDDPAARLQLAHETYGVLGEWATAELGFMQWEVERGVLDPPSAPDPGSPWWRAINEDLLRDAIEGKHRAADGSTEGARDEVTRWVEFYAAPSPTNWYRAHNASVVKGYFDHADLAAKESRFEQKLLNLTLMRVLYAEALEEDADLGLGLLAHIGRMLADPRATGVGRVVRVPAFYPRHYPLDRDEDAALDHHMPTPDGALIALLDDAVVFPRLGQLYALAAEALPEPRLPSLERDGTTLYPEAALAPVLAASATETAEATIAGAPPVHHTMPWVCAQRWENVLFCSWRVPVDLVRRLVPPELELDLHDGDAWVSVLPLKMAHVHLRDLPGVPDLTNFPELNLRTYVRAGGEPGVYFFSLDAPSRLAVWIGRHVFHVDYDTAHMDMSLTGDTVHFTSAREHADATFSAAYTPNGPASEVAPGSIEQFLCERYAMFGLHHDGHVVRGDIRHNPWQMRAVDAQVDATSVLRSVGFDLDRPPDHLGYSDATDNVVWPMVRVNP